MAWHGHWITKNTVDKGVPSSQLTKVQIPDHYMIIAWSLYNRCVIIPCLRAQEVYLVDLNSWSWFSSGCGTIRRAGGVQTPFSRKLLTRFPLWETHEIWLAQITEANSLKTTDSWCFWFAGVQSQSLMLTVKEPFIYAHAALAAEPNWWIFFESVARIECSPAMLFRRWVWRVLLGYSSWTNIEGKQSLKAIGVLFLWL